MEQLFRKQQKDFSSVWSHTNILYQKWAEYMGISYAAFMTLYGLDVRGSMMQKNICDFCGFTKQTVNGVVHDFVKQGYVSLEAGRRDRREKLVVFTEKGEAYAKKLLASLYQAEQYVFSTIGDEKISQMIDTIDAFNTLLEKRLEEAK